VKISVATNVARLAQRLAEMSDSELQRRLNELSPDEFDELREMSSADLDAAEACDGIPELEEAERIVADESEESDD
jgi:phage terminase Nu1 subunit (DNA packaging protein)